MTVRRIIATLVMLVLVSAHAPAQAAQQNQPSKPIEDGFVAGLVDQHEVPVTAARLLGKPAIVHFGFTHCPEVCPTTLDQVASLMGELGPQADQFNFVFITVDPERDTAAVLNDYISYFDKRIIGLTGSKDAIAALAKSFKTTYAKRPSKDGGYSMDHVIFAYLKDSNWATRSTLYLGAGANRKAAHKRLRALLPAE